MHFLDFPRNSISCKQMSPKAPAPQLSILYKIGYLSIQPIAHLGLTIFYSYFSWKLKSPSK